jgi:hypothetical protein
LSAAFFTYSLYSNQSKGLDDVYVLLSRKMKDGVDVLYKALLLGALCVDGRRGWGIGLLAAHGEGSAADGYGEGGDGELSKRVVSAV